MTIRAATSDDLPALKRLVAAIGLFRPDELEQLEAMMPSYLSGGSDTGDRWIVDDQDGLVGVAQYAPERMTRGTWNLYLIGVDPGHQGQGSGKALLAHVERDLQARSARVLIVETSGLDNFEDTRAFYHGSGFAGTARIPDFYDAGDDKVVFWKALGLRASSTTSRSAPMTSQER